MERWLICDCLILCDEMYLLFKNKMILHNSFHTAKQQIPAFLFACIQKESRWTVIRSCFINPKI